MAFAAFFTGAAIALAYIAGRIHGENYANKRNSEANRIREARRWAAPTPRSFRDHTTPVVDD